jgi:hypothetical protein
MSKYIISLPFLGNEFIPVLLQHVDKIAGEKGLNKEEISAELHQAVGPDGFRDVVYKYFKDEIKIILEKK